MIVKLTGERALTGDRSEPVVSVHDQRPGLRGALLTSRVRVSIEIPAHGDSGAIAAQPVDFDR